jgi:hypothetical protein
LKASAGKLIDGVTVPGGYPRLGRVDMRSHL